MAEPTVIVEIQDGRLADLYSNINIKFFLIDRDQKEAGSPLITGPFEPTLVKEDLSKAFPNEPEITQELLTDEVPNAYF